MKNAVGYTSVRAPHPFLYAAMKIRSVSIVPGLQTGPSCMVLVLFDLYRSLLLAPLQGLATWVLNCFIPVACVCLFNATLCFHTDIIKSSLIHYLCIPLLNYSHNSFMCYCIFSETVRTCAAAIIE